MNIGVFRLHASKRLDAAITLYAIWKYLPITMSVNLFCTLVWMLTFEFTTRGLNVTHARIFHYPPFTNLRASLGGGEYSA